MDNQSFFQHFKSFTSLSSCLHGFWQEVWYNSYACTYVRCSPNSVFLKDAVFVFGFLKLVRGRLEWEKRPSPVGIRFQQTLFPCRVVEKTLGISHNNSSFPPPSRSTTGSYSDLCCEDLVNFLKLGGKPWPAVLRSFHSSSSPHSSSSNLSKVPLLVFLPVWFQSLLQVSKFTSVSLWTFLKFQTLGWWFVLQPQFFDRSTKSHWFFGWNWPVQVSWKDGSDHFQVPVRAKIRKLFQNVYEKAQVMK